MLKLITILFETEYFRRCLMYDLSQQKIKLLTGLQNL
jgi:hypothetical protein